MPSSDIDEPQESPSTTSGPAPIVTGDLAGAAAAYDAAIEAQEAAAEALADAEGRATVVHTKVAAFEDDANKAEWQKADVRESLAKCGRAVDRATRKLARADAALAAAEARLNAEQEALVDDPSLAPEPPVARFATVDLFVERFVLPNWIHKAEPKTWCATWWEHAEAITRLEALWEAFEVMRQQPAPSFSTWLRDHFDAHMRALTDPDGVFYRCDPEKGMHEVRAPWPAEPAPEGMFAAITNAQIRRAVRAAEGDTDEAARVSPPADTKKLAKGAVR